MSDFSKAKNSNFQNFFENNYQYLQEYCVPSKFLTLNSSHSSALLRYNLLWNGQAQPNSDPSMNETLVELAKIINKEIANLGGLTVIRIGFRSGNDVTLSSNFLATLWCFNQCFSENPSLFELTKNPTQPLSDHTMSMWLQIQSRAQILTNGFDTINFIALSARLCVSLSKKADTHTVITLKKYLAFDPALEFRVFVSHHKITAVSQKYAIYSQWLVRYSESVNDQIQSFINNCIIPNCPEVSYAADIILQPLDNVELDPLKSFRDYNLAFINAGPRCKCIFLKIRSLCSTTSGRLYQWDSEWKLLLDGPYSFRYKFKETQIFGPHLGIPFVPKPWLDLIEKCIKKHNYTQNGKWIALTSMLAILISLWMTYIK